MVATSLADLAALLPPDLATARVRRRRAPATPHLLLVTDGATLPGNHVVPPDGLHGVTVLDLPARWDELEDATPAAAPARRASPARTAGTRCSALRLREEPVRGRADQCDAGHRRGARPAAHAAAHARRRRDGDRRDRRSLGPHGAARASATSARFDPPAAWRSAPGARPAAGADRPRRRRGGGPPRPQGVRPAGHGPARPGRSARPGSGKSELLRTLVLGLALTHSPEQLNMVLVDFKGGATFAGMSGLPHVSAVITNLAQELTLVDRMQDALSGELVRRQELLREAGNYASVRDYETRPGRRRATSRRCRRCSSWSTSSPSCCRPSRSSSTCSSRSAGSAARSGLHLLLASQRLEEGRLRGLESHLSYRVGLRTFCAGRVPRGARRPGRLRAAAGPRPGLPQARPVDAAAVQGGLRLRAAAGRAPRYAATRAAACRASCRSPSPRCTRSSRRAGAPSPRGPARPGEQESLLDVAVDAHGRPRPGRAPGVAAAARRARHPRRADGRPRRGPAPRPGLAAVARRSAAWSSRSAPSTGRASSAATR